MVLKNHIAYRFLTDDTLVLEMLQTTVGEDVLQKVLEGRKDELSDEKRAALHSFWDVHSHDGQKAFLITSTVIDKLSLLKVKRREDGHFDWSVFFHLPNLKYTLILPQTPEHRGGYCLRLYFTKGFLTFTYLKFSYEKNSDKGHAYWVMFFVAKEEYRLAEHFDHPDVVEIEERVYKMLCFLFLSENTEEVIKPGEKKGTQKSGKIINSLPFPLTVVNSKWNVTSIRTEGFAVRGHFAIRWTGEGRSSAKMVWINPFEKHGYIRKASKTA